VEIEGPAVVKLCTDHFERKVCVPGATAVVKYKTGKEIYK
jgi:hypothetical protein